MVIEKRSRFANFIHHTAMIFDTTQIIEKTVKDNSTVFHRYKEKILFQPK